MNPTERFSIFAFVIACLFSKIERLAVPFRTHAHTRTHTPSHTRTLSSHTRPGILLFLISPLQRTQALSSWPIPSSKKRTVGCVAPLPLSVHLTLRSASVLFWLEQLCPAPPQPTWSSTEQPLDYIIPISSHRRHTSRYAATVLAPDSSRTSSSSPPPITIGTSAHRSLRASSSASSESRFRKLELDTSLWGTNSLRITDAVAVICLVPSKPHPTSILSSAYKQHILVTASSRGYSGAYPRSHTLTTGDLDSDAHST